MSRFVPLLDELLVLQKDLQSATNRLWSVDRLLAEAYDSGAQENDFLLRRLEARRQEECLTFERLLYRCHKLLISSTLHNPLIPFESTEDVETIKKIRSTIRYIRNAFSRELPVWKALDRLDRVLPQ